MALLINNTNKYDPGNFEATIYRPYAKTCIDFCKHHPINSRQS